MVDLIEQSADTAQKPLAAVELPPGRHFAVTWSIPDGYGGLTSAMLHRSRAFVRLGGVNVDVVTFDARPDYPQVAKRLRESGELVDGMRLVNLWDWLRDRPAEPSPDGARHEFTPLEAAAGYRSGTREGVEVNRTRYADDGETVLQVDHYRMDGTLLASDRRDTAERGTKGGKSIVLCDARGEPVRSWNKTWDLYRFWLDRLTAGARAHMIVDSKSIANFMLTYRRPDVVTTHMVHGSHLVGNKRPMGTLRESRQHVFRNLDEFDSVVVLTERQRQDIELLLGEKPNLAVIPNGRDLSKLRSAPLPRPVTRGVVLASLTRRKRVDHAIRAFLAAQKRLGARMQLDIYGEGEEREALEHAARSRTGDDQVRLHGYRPNARQELGTASFLLITSTSEGFPLVLVEAMAAGCIPICYDMPYGPGDIVENGRNGFLVENGDREALADAMVRLQQLGDEEVLSMREQARIDAGRFSDLEVTRRWAEELFRASGRHDAATNRTLHRMVGRFLHGAFVRR